MRRSEEDNVLSNPTLTNVFGDTSNTRFSNTRKDRIGTAEIGVRGNFTTGPVKHTVVASAAKYSNDRDNAYAISAGSVRNNIYTPYPRRTRWPTAPAVLSETRSQTRA